MRTKHTIFACVRRRFLTNQSYLTSILALPTCSLVAPHSRASQGRLENRRLESPCKELLKPFAMALVHGPCLAYAGGSD